MLTPVRAAPSKSKGSDGAAHPLTSHRVYKGPQDFDLLFGFQDAKLFHSLASIPTGRWVRDLIVLGHNFGGEGTFCKDQASQAAWSGLGVLQETSLGAAPVSGVLVTLPSDVCWLRTWNTLFSCNLYILERNRQTRHWSCAVNGQFFCPFNSFEDMRSGQEVKVRVPILA